MYIVSLKCCKWNAPCHYKINAVFFYQILHDLQGYLHGACLCVGAAFLLKKVFAPLFWKLLDGRIPVDEVNNKYV